VKSFRDPNGFTLAVAEKRVETAADEAEVFDLVQLPQGTRPTPFASIELEEVNRCRVLDCEAYNTCLSFAARLQWPSFHCRQCPQYQESGTRRVGPRYGSLELDGDEAPDARVIKLR
jgi:hypothetical protein